MSRNEVTEKIIAAKVRLGLKWSDVAAKVGMSKEWVTAACLGQMTLNPQQTAVVGEIFGLSEQERRWLTVVPYKGSLPSSVPTAVMASEPAMALTNPPPLPGGGVIRVNKAGVQAAAPSQINLNKMAASTSRPMAVAAVARLKISRLRPRRLR